MHENIILYMYTLFRGERNRARQRMSLNDLFWNSQSMIGNENFADYFWEFQSKLALWEYCRHGLLGNKIIFEG